jgi:hypothetical protein
MAMRWVVDVNAFSVGASNSERNSVMSAPTMKAGLAELSSTPRRSDITEFLSLFDAPTEKLSQWLSYANSIFNRLEDSGRPMRASAVATRRSVASTHSHPPPSA